MGELGKLIVRIGADTKELVDKLGESQKGVTGFVNKANAALKLLSFAAITASVYALGKAFASVVGDTINFGSELSRLSQITGISVADFARLKFAAEQNEGTVEGLTKGIATLTNRMVEARAGNKDAVSLFDSLNISLTNVDGTAKTSQAVFLELADRIKNTSDQTVALWGAQEALGRSGRELLPLLKNGSAAIRQMGVESEKLGLSGQELEEFVAKAKNMEDTWKAVNQAFLNLRIKAIKPLLPKIQEMLDKMLEWDWRKIGEDIAFVVDKLIAVATWVGKVTSKVIDFFKKAEDRKQRILQHLDQGGTINPITGKMEGGAVFGKDREGQPTPTPVVDPGENHVAGGGPPAPEAGGPGIDGPEKKAQQSIGGLKEIFKQLEEQFSSMMNGMGTLTTQFLNAFTSGFGSAFAKIIGEGANFKETVKQFWQDLKMAVLQAIGEMIAKWLAFQALKMAGRAFGLPFFDKGGFVAARNGLVYAANGAYTTGPMGEGGIPAVLHPGEVVSPIDKLFDFMKGMQGNKYEISINGGNNDPQRIAESVILEVERKSRRA